MSITQEMNTNQDIEEKELENTSKTKKKSRKRKINAIKDDDDEIKDEPKKKKRKKKRGWSEEEERAFAEGLELYGRDWHKVSSHVGNNRNTAAIRSHAQTYLLRVLQNGIKLPNKILETGNGYTLSGKPLNKYSVVAIRHFNGSQNVPMVDGVISDEENVPTKRSKGKKSNNNNNNNNKKKKCKKKKKKKYYDSSDDSEDEFEEYETNTNIIIKTGEVRRSNRNRKQIIVCDPPHISNPYGLRSDIEIYDNMIKEKENRNKHKIYEPFKILYCPNALLIADIHSHLLRSVEIMGLLGGTYDFETRTLFIKKCYPLDEEQQNQETVSAHSTEILSASERIKNIDGLEMVGWYHSHPCFDNVPSNLDCHQHSINKYDNEKKQPYVGLIIQSLWNRDNQCSHWRWFNTKLLNKDNRNDYQYIALQFNGKEKVFNMIDDDELFKQIKELIERYNNCKYDIYRTDFGENGIAQQILNNIKYHLKRYEDDDEEEEENNNGDDDNDKQVQMLIKKIEQLFLKQSKIWWVTNRPKVDNDEENNPDNKQ